MKNKHPEQKALAGKELYEATWEDAKAFCEAQERELFETSKANGGYWLSNKADLLSYRRYVEDRLNEHDFAINRINRFYIGVLIGSFLGTAVAYFLMAIFAG